MSDPQIEELEHLSPLWLPLGKPLHCRTILNCEKKQLSVTPNGISLLTNLEQLWLNENQILSIPEWISLLTRLQILRFDSNQLTYIPDGISCLTNLTIFRVDGNKIISIPDGISCLTGLNTLSIRDNQITSVPNGISRLTKLTILRVEGNKITTIPDGISCLTGLNALQFDNNQITSVPNGISRLTNLTYLDVESNKVTTIPDGISCLTGLNQLYFFRNQITSVPNGISQLTNLAILRVDGNQITTIPDGISCLTGLDSLQLNNNQITSVPNGITRLTNLTLLRVDGNQITTIPDGVSCLTGLIELNISGNPIQELPPGISCLLKLEKFYIQDANGVISVKRAPKGISNLPCWNCANVYGGMTIANALRKLSLYDPVEEARKVAEEQKRKEEEEKRRQQPVEEQRALKVSDLIRRAEVATKSGDSKVQSFRNLATNPTSSTLSTRQQGNTPTSPLVGVKLADILSLDFEKKENVLGNGGFGLVFKVQLNAGTFAVKLIANAALLKDADSEKEGEMMLKLQHPNIIALYDFGFRNRDLLFIMEYADGGDLCSLIKKNKALNQKETMKYGLDIIQGLVYLHTRTPAIQHRDLKTENVLLVKGVAKLTDFGLSKSGASVNSASGFKGSVKWSPPEAFDYGKSMGLPSDVYSYGVVLWSMVTGEYPHKDLSEREVGKKVTDGPLPIPPSCPPGLAGLLKKCWEKDYEKRIKAIDVETLLKEVIENPNAVVSASSGSVITMNTAELVKYLEGKNALKKFIDAVRENEVSGKDFLELDEDTLTSAPFSLTKFQAKVILQFVEEAKRT